jgi:hypothetical protein
MPYDTNLTKLNYESVLFSKHAFTGDAGRSKPCFFLHLVPTSIHANKFMKVSIQYSICFDFVTKTEHESTSKHAFRKGHWLRDAPSTRTEKQLHKEFFFSLSQSTVLPGV